MLSMEYRGPGIKGLKTDIEFEPQNAFFLSICGLWAKDG
jgi:hypothetical protein